MRKQDDQGRSLKLGHNKQEAFQSAAKAEAPTTQGDCSSEVQQKEHNIVLSTCARTAV